MAGSTPNSGAISELFLAQAQRSQRFAEVWIRS